MRLSFTILFCISLISVKSQSTANFENLKLEKNTYLNGSDEKGGFESGSFFFPNSYNSQFSSFTGWAISSTTDTTTVGYQNQYSCINGIGNDASNTYALAYAPGETYVRVKQGGSPKPLNGLYLNNGTYGTLSMKNGDNFAKRFGGVGGDDKDFFMVTFFGYLNGRKKTDSVNFYLADFRFEDNKKDYIITEWTFVDLSVLGVVDSFSFVLNSSDKGDFGMNTPAYLFIDDVSLDTSSSISFSHEKTFVRCYPNPTNDLLYIDSDVPLDIAIYTLSGELALKGSFSQNEGISLTHLPKGIYFIHTSMGYGRVILF